MDSSERQDSSCAATLGISAMLILIGVFVWQAPALKGESAGWASWVQAFGSIGAILGAVWIASMQFRRTERDQERLVDSASREVAYLAYDVLQFLIRTSSSCQSKKARRYYVIDAEFQELLERLVWARRHVVKSQDLEDLADIRNALTEVTQHNKENEAWVRTIPDDEVVQKRDWIEGVRDISEKRKMQRHKPFQELGQRPVQ